MKAAQAEKITNEAKFGVRDYDKIVNVIRKSASKGYDYASWDEHINADTCNALRSDGYFVSDILGGTHIAWGKGWSSAILEQTKAQGDWAENEQQERRRKAQIMRDKFLELFKQ